MLLAIVMQQAKEHIHNLKWFPESAIVEVNNSKMLLLPRQGAIHQDLYEYKKREPLCTDYLLNSTTLKKGDTVLDIGANIGYYVLVESQLVGQTGKIYAVEPVSRNFRMLKTNVHLNKLKNVSTYRYAFGGETADSEIYVSDKANLCAMTKRAAGGVLLGKEKVPMETVDAFLKDKTPPNLIRMDVEGFEYEIFKGMTNTLKGKSSILMELHYGFPFLEPEKVDEMFAVLEKNRFRVKFAVFEDKVKENVVIRSLLKKGGYKLPIVAVNMSIQEFKELLQRNPMSPNVLFEKQGFCS
jgi:FkbM family methyltransferase